MGIPSLINRILRKGLGMHVTRSESASNQMLSNEDKILQYIQGGRIPWSMGYDAYRWSEIEKAIAPDKNNRVAPANLTASFGKGLDERIIEYNWIFSRLTLESGRILDAGSTFNFGPIVTHPTITKNDLTIFTYYPEGLNFSAKKISYVYGDLREMPFKENLFDVVVCQSTIEHIDMDNSIYGYKSERTVKDGEKSYEYMKAVAELVRVVRQKGKMLLTFPYGKFEYHGFFQQFDHEMTERIVGFMKDKGQVSLSFFRYCPSGWANMTREGCDDAVSYNPHTGEGKGTDGAAHCRGICCIEFEKQ